MTRLTRDALLGASDLTTREVEVPSIGGSVLVRSLPAAYSNQAQSESLEMVTLRTGEQTARVNTQKLEELQVFHGLIEPKLASVDEARQFAQQVGKAWRQIVSAIDEISGVDKEAIERTNTMFQSGGSPETISGAEVNGVGGGDGRSDLPLPARAGVENAGE